MIPADKYPPRRQCAHGSLRRSCELCERDDLISALRAKCAQLQQALDDAARVEALLVAGGLLPQAKFDQAREIVRMGR